MRADPVRDPAESHSVETRLKESARQEKAVPASTRRAIAALGVISALCVLQLWPLPWPNLRFAGDLLANVVFGLNAFVVGSAILTYGVWRRDASAASIALNRLQWSFLALALGLGLFSWVMMPLGLVLPYDRTLFRSVHGALLLAGAPWLIWSPAWRAVRRSWTPLERISRIEGAAWAAVGLTLFYFAFIHVHSLEGSDGQTAHLYSVLHWENARRLVPPIHPFDQLPFTLNSAQPFAGRLLMLHVDLLGSIFATGALNVGVIAVTALGAYTLGSVLFGQAVGRLGALVWLTSPVLYREFAIDVTDYPVNAMLFVAVCAALALALESRSRAWLALSCALAGMLYGVKMLGLVDLAVLTPIAVVLLKRRGMLRGAATSLAVGVVVALPWLIWPWVTYGNPVWPVLNGFFGGLPLSVKWHLFLDTHWYAELAGDLSTGRPMWRAVVGWALRDWFPPRNHIFAFTPLLMPALAYFAVAAWRRRVYLIPLAGCAGFLAIALAGLLADKYMLIPLASVAPFIALAIDSMVRARRRAAAVATLALSLFVVAIAWQVIVSQQLDARRLGFADALVPYEPFKTLNALPEGSMVLGNLQGMDFRYNRVYWNFPFVADYGELIYDDWQQFYDFYARFRPTHYLVQDRADRFGYDEALLPWVERYDTRLAEFLRGTKTTFDRNKEKRNRFLQSKPVKDLAGGYHLYELR